MQPVEIRHGQIDIARKRLQPAAGIAGAVAQDRVAHGVGDPRLHFLETGVLAPDPLAGGEADAAAALLDRRNQVGQERRIVLSVAVERRHDGAARGANAAAHRRRLSGRIRMPKLPEIWALRHDRSKPFGRRIRRAVIDVDDLIGPAAVERAGDFRDQRRDIVRLVAHGHNDGNGHGGLVGRRQIGTRGLNRFGWLGLKPAGTAWSGRSRRPLLWGESAPGNPFETPWRGSGQRPRWCRRGGSQIPAGGPRTSNAPPSRR